MHKYLIPYKRKGLYILITIPMIIGYLLIGILLAHNNLTFLIIYVLLFVLTILLQSYNCIYWECPHIGRMCPGAGGFCMLSSPVAYILIKLHVKGSKRLYSVLCSIASLTLLGIIVFPVYFIFKLYPLYVLLYFGLIIAYGIGMMLLICPYCGARKACPGGLFSTKLVNRFMKNSR